VKRSIRIGHHDGDRLAVSKRVGKRSTNRGRHFDRSALVKHPRKRRGRAIANGRDVEPHDGRGQESHIGQHRETSADARMMLQQRHLVSTQERAQPIRLARIGGLAQPEE
jgi:hypothetical protein